MVYIKKNWAWDICSRCDDELVLHFSSSFRILVYPVLAGYTQFYQQKSCFAQVPSIKTKVAHSRNKMYYFIFMVCDILTFIWTWSKLWVNAFTLYVVFQYYCIASIYCNANSHWLGSTKGCPSFYSHVGYFDLFIENKVGDFFLFISQ